MPRTARATVGGYCYHALNRGNARAQVFHHDGDYTAFTHLLRQASARVPMRLLAYCLMPNHFHRAVWPHGDADLSAWMHWLMTAHVRGYRKQYRGSGHIWQGRFQAFPMQEDEHLWTVLRYIECNPLRAGLVQRAEACWCRGCTPGRCPGRRIGSPTSTPRLPPRTSSACAAAPAAARPWANQPGWRRPPGGWAWKTPSGRPAGPAKPTATLTRSRRRPPCSPKNN